MSERANELTLRPSAVEKIGFSAAPHSTAAGRIQDAKAHRRLKSHLSWNDRTDRKERNHGFLQFFVAFQIQHFLGKYTRNS
jgi:hypothetical protein